MRALMTLPGMGGTKLARESFLERRYERPELGRARFESGRDAEFLQRPTPRDRLSHSLGQFIESVHNSPFGSLWSCSLLTAIVASAGLQ